MEIKTIDSFRETRKYYRRVNIKYLLLINYVLICSKHFENLNSNIKFC